MTEKEKLELCHRLSLWINHLWRTPTASVETIRTCSLQAMDFVRAVAGGEIKCDYGNRSRIIVMLKKCPHPNDLGLLHALREFMS